MRQRRRSISVAEYRDGAGEHALQVSILLYLSLHGKRDVFAFSIPNAGKRSMRQATKMKREGLLSGVADLCVMMSNGRTGWLECKTMKGRQSMAQLEFEENCRRLSHNYELCRDLPDAIDALRSWGALR
jgi:hypothetical protein